MKQIKDLLKKLKTANEQEQTKLILDFIENQKKTSSDKIEQLNMQIKELQKDQDIFKKITEYTTDIIALTTLELNPKQIYVSPSIKNVLGYKTEELVGRSFFEFIHPEDKNIILPLLTKYIQKFAKKLLKIGDQSLRETIEFRAKNKTGEWLYMQSTINFFGKNLLSITRDITEQKEVNDILRKNGQELKKKLEELEKQRLSNAALLNDLTESNKQLKEEIEERKIAEEKQKRGERLLEQTEHLAKIGGWEYDVINKKVSWTNEVYHIYGVNPENFDPNKIPENISFYYKGDRKLLNKHFQEAISKGKPYDLQLRFMPLNGDLHWVRTIAQPQIEKGKVIKLSGHIMDITKSKIAEEMLVSSENKYRNLLETAGSIIITMDKNANLTAFNQSAEEITGYKKDEVLGKNWFETFIPDEDQLAIMEVFKHTLETIPEAFIHENEIVMKDGSKKIISWNNNVVRDNTDKVIGILSIGRDVTEINKAREQLKKFSNTQKILLSEVNHRVKNNLTALISILHKANDLAEEKGMKTTTILPVMEERINSLLNVHSLLSESGWQSVKLTELCETIVGGVVRSMTFTNRVQLNVQKSEVMINSDLAHNLTIVLNELAINSLKYGFTNTNTLKIHITIKEKKNLLTLRYSDNGRGYPKKLLKGDHTDIGVGFDLLKGIVEQSLSGKLQITNDAGAVTIISFENE